MAGWKESVLSLTFFLMWFTMGRDTCSEANRNHGSFKKKSPSVISPPAWGSLSWQIEVSLKKLQIRAVVPSFQAKSYPGSQGSLNPVSPRTQSPAGFGDHSAWTVVPKPFVSHLCGRVPIDDLCPDLMRGWCLYLVNKAITFDHGSSRFFWHNADEDNFLRSLIFHHVNEGGVLIDCGWHRALGSPNILWWLLMYLDSPSK